MTTGKLMKIGDAARRLGVAVSTVRKYESAGIVLPVRTIGKHRLFSEDDLYWLGCVRELITHKGMTIEAIKRMASLVPCWEMRRCPTDERSKCPAYTDDTTPCWLLGSTRFDCSITDCRTCIVYKSVTHCENLKVLISELVCGRS